MLYIFPFFGKISKYGLELTGLQWTPVDCPTKMWVDLAGVHMELGGTVKTSRNIPFHTQLALPCSLHQKTITEPYTPSSHREMTLARVGHHKVWQVRVPPSFTTSIVELEAHD